MNAREMFQRDMFDEEPTAPYVHGSETSKEAAESIEPSMNTLQREVYAFVRKRGIDGATDEEIQDALNMNPSTERPRRRELDVRGLIAESGFTRLTRSGRRAVVWVTTDQYKVNQIVDAFKPFALEVKNG